MNFKDTMERVHNHGKRVGTLATSFASRIGLNQAAQFMVFVAGRWHDHGKLAMDLSILNKPGELTKEEFEEMKNHSLYSEILLRECGYGEGILEIVLHHHEDWNGGGYPYGLVKDEIPIGAQIIRLCDVFDALVEQRLYKETISPEKAMVIMCRDNELGKYNPELFKLFKEEVKEMDRDVAETVGTFSRSMPRNRGSLLLLGRDE